VCVVSADSVRWRHRWWLLLFFHGQGTYLSTSQSMAASVYFVSAERRYPHLNAIWPLTVMGWARRFTAMARTRSPGSFLILRSLRDGEGIA
jgi:hypothetical protein